MIVVRSRFLEPVQGPDVGNRWMWVYVSTTEPGPTDVLCVCARAFRSLVFCGLFS